MKMPAAFLRGLLLLMLASSISRDASAFDPDNAEVVQPTTVKATPEQEPAKQKRDWSKRFVYEGSEGRLNYDLGSRGDRVPDFSHCGFGGGGKVLPKVGAVVAVAPSENDGARIQEAIDHVSRLPLKDDGFRGAVLLLPGIFRISGSLHLRHGGVVLRGSGSNNDPLKDRSTLFATGESRRSLIRIKGGESPVPLHEPGVLITDQYVPCGATKIEVESSGSFRVGDLVCIEHPGSREWISELRMNTFPSRDVGSWLDWRPGTINTRWLREIREITGNSLTLDAPITSALDRSLTQSVVRKCMPANLVQNVGVESLICVSQVSGTNPKDEDHAWNGVMLQNVSDAWISNVTFTGFCGSAVSVLEGSRRVSVIDCASTDPVSEDGGWRRHTFSTSGTQTLFLRCKASHGRRDFVVGHASAGPNAFSFCESTLSSGDSGPVGSWASGVLYDNVTIDGGALALTNHETADHGVGWSSANSVLWNCVAPRIICRQPPTAQNWAIGVWGEFTGDGCWRQPNEFVGPDSLLVAQLKDRLGDEAAKCLDRATNVRQSVESPSLLTESAEPSKTHSSVEATSSGLILRDGRFLLGGQLAAGRRQGGQWWRGTVLPDQVHEFSDCITRFVPGREGRGFTDDLNELTDRMRQNGVLIFEHHWGLWYDRRRDDHQFVRRIDGGVWPPFYEQPWARSGSGTAWDGLSRYDLANFNPWYFNRLREFAGYCDEKGLVLFQQMYFQHNVLEAGAHWADFPWRPVNCLQSTEFPEPPPLENRKRIFLANDFWDVKVSVRRDLHSRYIRHCLNQLGDFRNVVFSLGEEFTGRAEFAEFWLDEISAWQLETGKDVLVCLSCTKDVQDQILDQPKRAAVVDVIDQRYWWYTSDGSVFAPKGGLNLSPRQQLREHKGNHRRTGESIARGIEEYRQHFPSKAVMCSFPEAVDSQLISAGGSFPFSNSEQSAQRD